MVAAVGAVDVAGGGADPGCAAELAGEDDQCLVEQTARRQVVKQGRDSLVGRRQQPLFQTLEVASSACPRAEPAPC